MPPSFTSGSARVDLQYQRSVAAKVGSLLQLAAEDVP